MKMKSFQLFKPGDIFFWGLICTGLIFGYPLLFSQAGEPSLAMVEIDGEIAYQFNLQNDAAAELTDFQPSVKLEIENNAIRISENSCKHKICMTMGPIKTTGEMIVCVPKKILIYIPKTNETQKPVNAVTG